MKDKDKMNNMDALKRCFDIIYRQGRTMENCRIKNFHLSSAQSRYMMEIYKNPGISQYEIVKKFNVDKGSVARAVKKLENEGYIVRKKNEKDSRAFSLNVTDKGYEHCSNKIAKGEEMTDIMLDGFTDEEVKTLVNLLERATDNMNVLYHKIKTEGGNDN